MARKPKTCVWSSINCARKSRKTLLNQNTSSPNLGSATASTPPSPPRSKTPPAPTEIPAGLAAAFCPLTAEEKRALCPTHPPLSSRLTGEIRFSLSAAVVSRFFTASPENSHPNSVPTHSPSALPTPPTALRRYAGPPPHATHPH